MSPKNTQSVSENGTQVNTELMAARLERMAPSMRDGKSEGRLERSAQWCAHRLGLDASDVLDDMINFLWGRPDLLGSDNTDAWLAQRAVYAVRGKKFEETRRGREVVSLEEIDPDGEVLACDELDDAPDLALDGDRAADLQTLVSEILENADQVFHASSGAVNISCLSRRMGLRRETVKARLQEVGTRLCRPMGTLAHTKGMETC